MKITKRALTIDEMDSLSSEMKNFPHIGFIDRRLWQKYENIFVATHNNSLIGVCVAIHLKHWIKLGPLVVRKAFQGRGYGDALLSYAVYFYKNNDLYIGSANPRVWVIADKLGFLKTKNIFCVPFEIQRYLLSYIYERFSYVYLHDAIKKRLQTTSGQYFYFFKRAS